MRSRVRFTYAASITVLAAVACTSSPDEPASAGGAESGGSSTEVRDDLMEVFEEARVVGTFVVYDPDSDSSIVVNADRAEERMVPASTFKVAHSLIALETGAAEDVDEVIPYEGGESRFPDEWEQDMSMREALPESNLLIYQVIAARIGLDRMREHVELLEYGNAEIGDVIDEFWLFGPLEISAREQVRFLSRLATGELPVAEENQEHVRDITLVEERDDCRLHAKTGWAFDLEPQRGWWVGWVACGAAPGHPGQVVATSQVRAFALNIDIEQDDQADLREPIARELLDRLDVYSARA
ncbi:MAG TPA: class D beta-lactamase [Jiangellaceae bacterium]